MTNYLILSILAFGAMFNTVLDMAISALQSESKMAKLFWYLGMIVWVFFTYDFFVREFL